MAFPSFDEWQAPWEKKGEDFDADTAKKFIYNLHKEADTVKATRATERQADRDKISELEGKVQTFEDKDLTEVERLRKENERLKESGVQKDDKGGDDLAVARLELALEHGLTKAQARRLAGATREELEADAKEYKAEVSGKSADDDGDADDGEQDNGEMPSNRPQGRFTGGFGKGAGSEAAVDPSKMAELGIGRY